VDPDKEGVAHSDLGETTSPRETIFESLYQAHYQAVRRYVIRRVWTNPVDASEVTAEVFTVVWRRRADIPEPPEDLLWLYGVARKVVSRHFRSLKRRERLWDRLVAHWSYPTHQFDADVDEREVIRQAIGELKEAEREALRLVMWEQLTHAEAARVLSCSENAVSLRIYRAKRHLAVLLGPSSEPPESREGER
jgi:RNA polymerase sigma factor (sigma-70 family)